MRLINFRLDPKKFVKNLSATHNLEMIYQSVYKASNIKVATLKNHINDVQEGFFATFFCYEYAI